MKDTLCPEIKKYRKTAYPIHPLIQNRWSPRSMTGEEIPDEALWSLFEAARWAPSSYNEQPWRFIYAKKNTPEWDTLFNLMVEFNKSWAKNAAVLLVVISHNNFERNNKPAHTHSYDTGAAWMALALEGNDRGYVIHGMEGFNYEKARKDLEIPDDYTVEAMGAIGVRASKDLLPDELQKKEQPSDRKPISAFIMKGKFINPSPK